MYSDAHRLFLQVMLIKRSIPEREAEQLMKECCNEFDLHVHSLEAFVVKLNVELQDMQLAVRSTTEEREDGDHPCLALVNLMGGEATRELSSFSKPELAFIQRLVGEIVASENGEVDINTALNIGPTLPTRMKLSACEDLIALLVRDKWLLKSYNEYGKESVSLSGLSVVELATYLEETYPEDVKSCFFCTKTALKGYRCDQCNIVIHRECGKKYWANREGSHECPTDGCTASLLPVASSSQPKRSRRSHTEEEEGDEEEEEEDEDE